MADLVAAEFSRLSEFDRERQEIEELAQVYRRLTVATTQLHENRALLEDADEELRELAQLEIEAASRLETLDQQMKSLLLPKDPKDEKNVIVEIRAGTGGEEAGLFASELYRMYIRWSEAHRYKYRRTEPE